MILGKISSTGDMEGEIEEYSDKVPSQDEVIGAIKRFIGEIEQVPPNYSAIKINGVRAYKLARRGTEFSIPARIVRINSLKITSYSYPEILIVCDVSSGTYIRTLVEDLGIDLSTGAYTKSLRRLSIGNFKLDSAIEISKQIDVKIILNNLITKI